MSGLAAVGFLDLARAALAWPEVRHSRRLDDDIGAFTAVHHGRVHLGCGRYRHKFDLLRRSQCDRATDQDDPGAAVACCPGNGVPHLPR